MVTRAILYTSIILATGGIALLLVGRWLRPRWTAWAALGISLAALIPLLRPGGPESIVLWEWLPENGWPITATLHSDTLSLAMALLAAGPAFLLLLWMGLGAAEEEGPWTPFLLLLSATFLLIVSSTNLLLAYAGWEALILVTYLLLTYRRSTLPTPGIAEWFLGSQHLAGYVLLFALIGIGQPAGTWDYAQLGTGAVTPLVLLLLLITAWVRMALVPFQGWALGMAESPGPVSTLLLGSWGLLPGVYFWLRLLPLATAHTPREPVLIAGTAGLLLGAALALRQESSRRVQVGDTIARLGLIWVALGLDSPLGSAAGLLLLLDLLLSKVAFHLALANRGLSRPLRQGLFLLGAWQALGLPPSFGFAGRWLLVLGLFQAGRAFYLPFLLLATPLTLAYLWRGWTLIPEGTAPPSRLEAVIQQVTAAMVGLVTLAGAAVPWMGLNGRIWQPEPLGFAELDPGGVYAALQSLGPWLPAWALLLLLMGGLGAWWSGALAAPRASSRLIHPPGPQEETAGSAESTAQPIHGAGLLQEPLPVLPQETSWLDWISRPTPLFRLLGRVAAILAIALHRLVTFLERHTTYFLLVVLVAAAIVLIVLTR